MRVRGAFFFVFYLFLSLFAACSGSGSGGSSHSPGVDAEGVMGRQPKNFVRAVTKQELELISVKHDNSAANRYQKIVNQEMKHLGAVDVSKISISNDGRKLSMVGETVEFTFVEETVEVINQNPEPVIEKIPPPVFHHTAFITSGTYWGDLGGLAGADALCAAAAGTGSVTSGLTGTWKAVLSDSTLHARDRFVFNSGVVIKNSNGETVVSSAPTLWGGVLSAAIKYDENGIVRTDSLVHTGTNANGTRYSSGYANQDNCDNWSVDSDSSYSAQGGLATAVNGQWLSYTTVDCENRTHLLPSRIYCINVE